MTNNFKNIIKGSVYDNLQNQKQLFISNLVKACWKMFVFQHATLFLNSGHHSNIWILLTVFPLQ